jgi:hypothetical protein
MHTLHAAGNTQFICEDNEPSKSAYMYCEEMLQSGKAHALADKTQDLNYSRANTIQMI